MRIYTYICIIQIGREDDEPTAEPAASQTLLLLRINNHSRPNINAIKINSSNKPRAETITILRNSLRPNECGRSILRTNNIFYVYNFDDYSGAIYR
jgi:hypothetical protein